MKTIVAFVILLASTSVLAVPSNEQAARVCENSNNHASFCRESNGTNISVPEPSTLTLIGLGMLGLAVARIRKR